MKPHAEIFESVTDILGDALQLGAQAGVLYRGIASWFDGEHSVAVRIDNRLQTGALYE